MTRNLLLWVHIAGAAAWLGANFVQLLLTPRFARQPNEVARAWTEATLWLGRRYYNAAGGIIAVSGIALVLDGDWGFGRPFVVVGITVVVLGGVLGVLGFEKAMASRSEALTAGETSRAAAVLRRIIILAVVDTALVLTALLAMVSKWGV